MKKQYSVFILLVMGLILVGSLSLPFSSSADRSKNASIFESIQRQLNEILAAIMRIQVRIAELLQEEAAMQNQIAEQASPSIVESSSTTGETSGSTASSTVQEEAAASTEPVWKYLPVPTTYIANGLMVLYHFSVTAGAADATIASVPYAISYADISIKDLEVHAFIDDLFSQKAYEINPVGKRRGIVQSGVPFSIDISDKTAALVIPAGGTRYFELQGITTGKNISAFITASINGMEEVRF